ncbi:hypothetical protein IEO21_07977 [Rhodonia placenta]|uniref:Uncharacterized protein n=1 Tax=Rhodonia placenta TaxID=104341 RepID=A0A8H7NX14_9APHY|nr:hypothetical protein IEO21_07977 [Postia placenta]
MTSSSLQRTWLSLTRSTWARAVRSAGTLSMWSERRLRVHPSSNILFDPI